MNEDNFDELRLKDVNLREAIRMEEMERPQMPVDLNARLMKRVDKEVNHRSQRKRIIWPLVAAACVAGIVAIFLTPPRTTEGETHGIVVAHVEAKPEQKPVQHKPEAQPEQTESQQKEVKTDTRAEQKAKQRPLSTPRQEPMPNMMAEAEPSKQQVVDVTAEKGNSLLALLEEKADMKVAPEEVTLSERDIPVTRPENLKYTQEEIAQMKRQSNEAYLKWMELELEISKFNLEQSAQR